MNTFQILMKQYRLVVFLIFHLTICTCFVTIHSQCPPTVPAPQPMPPPPPPPPPPGPSSKPCPPQGTYKFPPAPQPVPSVAPCTCPCPSDPSPRQEPPKNVTVPALFVFGDSLVDTGNNNNVSTPLRCNFRPYGIDFLQGVPTGRYSDGKVPSDFLAEYLGIKSVVPAYMDPRLQPDDLLTGVCFASGGSGYIPLTPTYLNVIPMLNQLTYFQHYIARVKKLVGQEKGDQIIANGLAIVVAGSNDMGITYYGPGAQWVKDDIYSFTSNMVDSATSFVMQLYGYGARHIGVAGMTPLGCIPAQRTLKGGPHRKCAQDVNYAAQIFNAKLSTALGHLAKALPDSKLVFMDIYSPFSQIIENPADYGFEVINRGCCGTGLVETGPLCNQETSTVCRNISAYLFWDSFHPSQRLYEILSKILVKKYIPLLF